MSKYLIVSDGGVVIYPEMLYQHTWTSHIQANDDVAYLCQLAKEAMEGKRKLPCAEPDVACRIVDDLEIRPHSASVLILEQD